MDFLIETLVPNVPCGVESHRLLSTPLPLVGHVPNVPCGVESSHKSFYKGFLMLFLMYRVELKANCFNEFLGEGEFVPNVPCGVER